MAEKNTEKRKKAKAEDVILDLVRNGGKIGYFPAETELDKTQFIQYCQNARMILETSVFHNEVNALIDNAIENAALRSADYNEVRDWRMTANGLILLRQRLQQLAANAVKAPDVEFDPHAPI